MARRENRGGIARLPALNMLRDARFASRFYFFFSSSLFRFLGRRRRFVARPRIERFPCAARSFFFQSLILYLIITISAVLLLASLALNPYAVLYFPRDAPSARVRRRPRRSEYRKQQSSSTFHSSCSSVRVLSYSPANLVFLILAIPCCRNSNFLRFCISFPSSYSSHLTDNLPGDCCPRTKNSSLATSPC